MNHLFFRHVRRVLLLLAAGVALAVSPAAEARVHWSVGIGFPGYYDYGPGWYGGWWGPSYAPYGGWYPPVVVEREPLVVQTLPPGPPPQSYWYYCSNPAGYYPYVAECPGGWRPVPVTPPPPAPAPAPAR